MAELPSARHIKRFATDPDFFRRNLMIDARGHVQRFVPEPWQQENLVALDPLWTRVAGLHDQDIQKRAWLGRPKGHSKTTDEAMQLVWAMCFSMRRITGLAVASATDQAKFIREGVIKLVLHNEWLAELIEVQGRTVVNKATGSHMDICSGEENISQGSEPDFVLIDELTHWKNFDLWRTMASSAGKRDHCCLIVMTNAGYKGDWHWTKREDARNNPSEWIFRDFDKPVASWMTARELENQRRDLREKGDSDKAFRRLWMNEWQEESSDELSREDIEACIHKGSRLTGTEQDWIFIGGLDIGVRKDRTGFVILAANPATHQIKLAHVQDWKAKKKKTVDLPAVRDHIIEQCQRFGVTRIMYDPSQAELMAQEIQAKGYRCEQYPFGAKNCSIMAARIIDVFRSRQIELFNHPKLIDDILKLKIVDKGFLMKIEAESDKDGHADLGFAFAIALPTAVEVSGLIPINPMVDSDRIILQTIDDLRQREAEFTLEDSLKAQGINPQKSVAKPFLPIPTGVPCPNCRKMLHGKPCECGEQYEPKTQIGMILQEAGVVW